MLTTQFVPDGCVPPGGHGVPHGRRGRRRRGYLHHRVAEGAAHCGIAPSSSFHPRHCVRPIHIRGTIVGHFLLFSVVVGLCGGGGGGRVDRGGDPLQVGEPSRRGLAVEAALERGSLDEKNIFFFEKSIFYISFDTGDAGGDSACDNLFAPFTSAFEILLNADISWCCCSFSW